MKTVTKVFIIIAISCVVIGSVLISVTGAIVNFDFTEIGTENANYQLVTKDYSVSEFEEMNFSSKNLLIKFAKSQDEKIHLKFYESEIFENNFIQSKNTISFVRRTKSWFNFSFGGEKSSVIVELPAGYDPKMTLTIDNGGLEIQNFKFSKQFTIDIANSLLNVDNSTFNGAVKFEIDNSTGNIETSTFGGNVDFDSSNTFYKFDNTIFAGTTTYESQNGTAKFDNVSFATINIQSSNGSVKFDNVSGDDFTFRLSNCGLRGDIAGEKSDYTIMISEQNSSSNISNQTATSGMKKFVADVSNGTINIDFTK